MPERDLPSADYERIEELVDFEPLREALVDALHALPRHQQEALRLRVLDGRTYSEVAQTLRCSEDNARQRVSRGLRHMGLALQRRGLETVSE